MSNLRINIPFEGPASGYGFGVAPPFSLPQQLSGERIFAFALADRTTPRVFDFDTSPDGIKSVANLIRTEQVIAVVRGHRANINRASVVSLTLGSEEIEDRLLLSDGSE
jgi:hypothetical protein